MASEVHLHSLPSTPFSFSGDDDDDGGSSDGESRIMVSCYELRTSDGGRRTDGGLISSSSADHKFVDVIQARPSSSDAMEWRKGRKGQIRLVLEDGIILEIPPLFRPLGCLSFRMDLRAPPNDHGSAFDI